MAKAQDVDRVLHYAAAQLKLQQHRGPALALYADDPCGFVHALLPTLVLAPYQEDILRALVTHRRVAVYGPHGLGKTMVESLAMLWFSMTRENLGHDWKAPTTASAWRQLTHYLWPEIRKWTRALDWKEARQLPFDEHTELLSMSLRLKHGEAFALASDNAASLEGAHADELLFEFDEAKTIPADTWDALEGAFSTGNAYALACSTPGEESGRFYEICSRKAGYEDWHVIHVTAEMAMDAGRISKQWVEDRKTQWGEESAVYQNRVAGMFASSASDGVIPLAWVEAAVERWRANDNPIVKTLGSVGVDVGGGGENGDLTTLALRSDSRITELRRFGTGDTMETTGRVASLVRAFACMPVVDVIGIGAGVVSRLREQDISVDAFNAAAGVSSRYTDKSGELQFANMRAWAWWNLREMLDPLSKFNVELPDDDLLIGDLTAPHWKIQSGGKIIIESKDDIRKRLGRSTDSGDSVVMAFTRNSQQDGDDITMPTEQDRRRLGEAQHDEDREMEEDFGGGSLWGKSF